MSKAQSWNVRIQRRSYTNRLIGVINVVGIGMVIGSLLALLGLVASEVYDHCPGR